MDILYIVSNYIYLATTITRFQSKIPCKKFDKLIKYNGLHKSEPDVPKIFDFWPLKKAVSN